MSDAPQKPRLEYDRSNHPLITRGQFRLLLLLLLIQVAMNAQSNYAPGVGNWIKEKWAEHQAAAAMAEKHKQLIAIENSCGSYLEPAGKVVWEEDPARAAKLLADSRYTAIFPQPTGLPTQPGFLRIPDGARAIYPSVWKALAAIRDRSDMQYLSLTTGSNLGLVFLHHRRSSSGAKRLVCVLMSGNSDIDHNPGIEHSDQPWSDTVSKIQRLIAVSLTAIDEHIALDSPITTLDLHPPAEPLTMLAQWNPPLSPTVVPMAKIDYADQLRLYAGQPDPIDASHFTIAYDLDGVAGTIDGYLRDDGTIRLQPQAGMVTGGQWYPHAK